MRTWLLQVMVVILCGCQPPLSDVRWALDTLELEPDGTDGIVGTQQWDLFDERWERAQRDTRQVCTVEAIFVGEQTETPACARCVTGWDVRVSIEAHDCPEGTLDKVDVLDAMTGVALGELAPRLEQSGPVLTSLGGWVRFPDRGWLAHGWVSTTSGDVAPTEAWDGNRSFTFLPAFAWELTEDPSTVP